jgi:hypothetical protein
MVPVYKIERDIHVHALDLKVVQNSSRRVTGITVIKYTYSVKDRKQKYFKDLALEI